MRIDIIEKKIGKSIKLFNRFEHDLLIDAIRLYRHERHWAASSLAVQLYEVRFTRVLIRHEGKLRGEAPSKNNVREQLESLREAESNIVEGRKSFAAIVDGCVASGLVSDALATRSKSFYKNLRIPVSHGLLSRLAELYSPSGFRSEFQTDGELDQLSKVVASEVFRELEILLEETSEGLK